MGIDTFAATFVLVRNMHRGVKIKFVLVVAFELLRLVVARRVHRFPWAVIQSIRAKDSGVIVGVIPGNIIHLGRVSMATASFSEAVVEEIQRFGVKF